MTTPIEANVFLGHNNTFSLEVNIDVGAGPVPVNLVTTGVTRMVIKADSGLQIDSDDEGEGSGYPFDWTTDGATGIVVFAFGGLSITEGRYYCQLVIFDPAHTDGQVWDTQFFIVVHNQVVT